MKKQTKKKSHHRNHVKIRIQDESSSKSLIKRHNNLPSEEYNPAPEAIRLAYYLANPNTPMLSNTLLASKFNIKRKDVFSLLESRQFLSYVKDLIPAMSDALIFHAYKRLGKEMKVSPTRKGNKGVEAAKIILQSKGLIKTSQTNILSASFDLEKVLDKLSSKRDESQSDNILFNT